MNESLRYPAREEMGRWLHEASQVRDMTTREISRRMNAKTQLSHTSVANLLNGRTVPRLVSVRDVARVLGLDEAQCQKLWLAAKSEKDRKGTAYRETEDFTEIRSEGSGRFSHSLSPLELESAREEVREKIKSNQERERVKQEEYYDAWERRALIEEEMEFLRLRLVDERNSKNELMRKLEKLEAEYASLTAKIGELEAELSRLQARQLNLTEESNFINEMRAEAAYEWGRRMEFQVIVLERQQNGRP
ncbi:hypothetical protein ACIBAH_35600 [Streptomyces sp. NPDC051445]|uniref:hypothetical protein n=1 Tax=Streptomyces sp. NPDC051445 TaxID=3365653 RepID=UPI00379CAA4C